MENGQDRLYLNDGSGTYTDITASRMSPDLDDTQAVALGDVDGDRDLDMVFGNTGIFGGQNRLYLNLLRQLHAPDPSLRIGHAYTLEAYLRYDPVGSPGLAVPFCSATTVSIPVPPYGVFRLGPSLPLPAFAIPQPAGVGTMDLAVPNDPGLVGARIYFQAVLVSASGQVRLSNATTDVIQ